LVLVQLCEEGRLLIHERFSGGCCHFGVRLEATIAADMTDVVAVFGKNPPDEQAAVAVGWILFAAH
jgi:hypothetical protein